MHVHGERVHGIVKIEKITNPQKLTFQSNCQVTVEWMRLLQEQQAYLRLIAKREGLMLARLKASPWNSNIEKNTKPLNLPFYNSNV